MPVVKLYGSLRKIPGGGGAEGASWNYAPSVRALLEVLCASSPELCQALLDQGALRPHIRVMVNGHDIELAQGLDTPLDEADQVSIFPPIVGG
jgi:molybdopterin converting factor small subunit